VRDFIVVEPVVPVSNRQLRETIANRLRYDRIGYGITFNNFPVAVRDGVVTVAGDARSYTGKASAQSRTKLTFCHSQNLTTSCGSARPWQSIVIPRSRNTRWIHRHLSALWLRAET
jgi:hypothetical protein